MAETLGTFSFVLHSHIPYVLAHGRSPHGTDWLSEAAAETYLPLLDVCHRLVAEGLSPKITLGLTPVLVEQLRDPSFQDELSDYLRGTARRRPGQPGAVPARGQLPHGLPRPLLGGLVRQDACPTSRAVRARHRRRVRGASRRRPYRDHHQQRHPRLLGAAVAGHQRSGPGQAGHPGLQAPLRARPARLLAAGMLLPPPLPLGAAAGRARRAQDPLAAQRHGRVPGRERHRLLLRRGQPAARRRGAGRLRRQVRPAEGAVQAVPGGDRQDRVPALHPLQALRRQLLARPGLPPASPCWAATRRPASRSGAASTATPATSGIWSSTRSTSSPDAKSLGLRYWRISPGQGRHRRQAPLRAAPGRGADARPRRALRPAGQGRAAQAGRPGVHPLRRLRHGAVRPLVVRGAAVAVPRHQAARAGPGDHAGDGERIPGRPPGDAAGPRCRKAPGARAASTTSGSTRRRPGRGNWSTRSRRRCPRWRTSTATTPPSRPF